MVMFILSGDSMYIKYHPAAELHRRCECAENAGGLYRLPQGTGTVCFLIADILSFLAVMRHDGMQPCISVDFGIYFLITDYNGDVFQREICSPFSIRSTAQASVLEKCDSHVIIPLETLPPAGLIF
ncbi:hypothetical protein DX185_17590 [Salmonella enterica]|nr:hypothetical protein [Salmonella enterica]ECL4818240.1 hypothetical protein [Salmonella enterica]EHJ8320803.1 hypothetical protein [Salmonella enterica subsp. enterica serovar Infantis]